MVTGHDDLAHAARRAVGLMRWSASIARSSCTRRSGSARAITICSTISWSIAASRRNAIATTRSAAAGSRPRASGSSSPCKTEGEEGLAETEQQGPEVLQPARQERRGAELGRPAGLADHGATIFRAVLGPDAKDARHADAAARIQPDVQNRSSARWAARKTPPSCGPKRPRAFSSTSRTCSTARACSVPFGIAQIGKSFRNEITPRNFTFRSREFEQMEIEFFCHPSQSPEWYQLLARPALSMVSRPGPGRRTAAAARSRTPTS